MNPRRFAHLILQLTPNNILWIGMLSLTTMVLTGLVYITKQDLFYEYLFGTRSSVTLIETSRTTLEALNEIILGNSTLNKILFVMFWMVIGLIVYAIVTSITTGFGAAERTVEEANYVHGQKGRSFREFSLKLALRIIALILFTMYLVLMYKVLLPFSILCARITAGDSTNVISWLYGLLGFVVLAASLYIGLILMRFVTLRPRVFGGWEDILIEEQTVHDTEL